VYLFLFLITTQIYAGEPNLQQNQSQLVSPLCQILLNNEVTAGLMYPEVGASLFEIFPYSLVHKDIIVVESMRSTPPNPLTQTFAQESNPEFSIQEILSQRAKLLKDVSQSNQIQTVTGPPGPTKLNLPDVISNKIKEWRDASVNRKIFKYRWKNVSFLDPKEQQHALGLSSVESPFFLLPRELQLKVLLKLEQLWMKRPGSELIVEDLQKLIILASHTVFTLNHFPTQEEYFPTPPEDFDYFGDALGEGGDRLAQTLISGGNSPERNMDWRTVPGLSPNDNMKYILIQFLNAKFPGRKSIDAREYISALSEHIEIYAVGD